MLIGSIARSIAETNADRILSRAPTSFVMLNGTIPGYPFPDDQPVLLTGATLNSLVELIVMSGLAPNPGVPFVRTGGGVVLSLFGGGSTALVRTTATISARSGTTPGGGASDNAVLVNWDGTDLSNGTEAHPDGQPILVKNLTGGTVASGKYGLAWTAGGNYWLIAEC